MSSRILFAKMPLKLSSFSHANEKKLIIKSFREVVSDWPRSSMREREMLGLKLTKLKIKKFSDPKEYVAFSDAFNFATIFLFIYSSFITNKLTVKNWYNTVY